MPHIHTHAGQYDFTVSAVILHQNKILLLHHHKLHMWLSPAGHVELDETPIEALYREAEEECGITRDSLTLVSPYEGHLDFERDHTNRTEPMPFDIDVHPIDDTHRHIDFGYILLSDTTEVTPEEGGAQDLRWFTLDEAKQLNPIPTSIVSRFAYALEFIQEKHT